ncbi:EamA family transporter [Streptomyces sp. NPDC059740]|uniref:EamA family transporter n=1 Tax=Streptomyces sp. NPDC059740 TaxID=3346926 RepID=UPI0036524D50
MDARENGTALGTGLVVAAAVLWGTVGPAQVLAGGTVGPAALGGWRLVVGGLVLGALTLRRPKGLRALVTGAVLRPLLVCTVSTGAYQAAFLSSVSRP